MSKLNLQTTLLRLYRVRADASGSIMVQFALVFIVFSFLVLGIVDFARYSEAKGILNSAALDAVALATTVPGLDVDDRTQAPYITAYNDVVTRARRLSTGTIFNFGAGTGVITLNQNADVVLPAKSPNETMLEAFEREPIVVSMQGTYHSLVPWLIPAININATASGYREPASTVSMPVVTDCTGKRLGSPNFNVQEYLAGCVCAGQNHQRNAAGQCACSLTQADCPAGQNLVIRPTQCFCGCASDQIMDANGNCICNPAQYSTAANGSCVCSNAPSGDPNAYCQALLNSAGAQWSSGTCQCLCGRNPNGSLPATHCANTGGNWNANSCSCNCPPGMTQATNGGCVCAQNTCSVCERPDPNNCGQCIPDPNASGCGQAG